MKQIKKLYHFLGGIQFALILIAASALMVIAGTLIESKTESHLLAAKFSYDHPLFSLLLGGFFINILLAALRRWPFKVKHVPFLITHLGLLMLLAGVMIKRQFGVQGMMFLIEGGASQALLLPGTYGIQIDKSYHALQPSFFKGFKLENENPEVKLIGYAPNASEQIKGWIKGDVAIIKGFKPFKVENEVGLIRQIDLDHQLWKVYTGRPTNIAEAIEKIYLQSTSIKITQKEKKIYNGPLWQLLETEALPAKLHLNFSSILGFVDPFLEVLGEKIPLDGSKSLRSSLRQVDLQNSPTLILLEDPNGDQYFFAFDPYGRVHVEPFRHDNLNSILVYDQGHRGYAMQKTLPFTSLPASRRDCEKADLYLLTKQLQNAFSKDSKLVPPLQVLKKACADQDLAHILMTFLDEWHQSGAWIYPKDRPLPDELHKIFSHLNLTLLSQEEIRGCHWCSLILSEIEQAIERGSDFIGLLEKRRWPLIEPIKQQEHGSLGSKVDLLSAQIFSLHPYLPDPDPTENDFPSYKAHLLSAYLRSQAIYLSAILPSLDELEQNERLEAANPLGVHEPIVLEAPLTLHHRVMPSKSKIEDNQPLIQLEIKGEKLSLVYDRLASGLKWPVSQGRSLIRFQPQVMQIPYRVRLRDARQINYPNSSQPFSFESDLWVTDLRNGRVEAATLSMNNVYETAEGYRFYLANISPPQETAVQRIQLIVNYDPAKYYVTYPGAIILSIGILMLFWLRPYKKEIS